ncbi:hypothetical protein HK100_012624 [Physocladia obscura]|uniref:Glycolipid transfer protein domain-containing protein n=1 Tax=Physocladia obscura TaxID=109957 RepID=A0AAD5T8H0_9FUNG|nr:hypothetical protein HK100_012624 [Physocladia obscura]
MDASATTLNSTVLTVLNGTAFFSDSACTVPTIVMLQPFIFSEKNSTSTQATSNDACSSLSTSSSAPTTTTNSTTATAVNTTSSNIILTGPCLATAYGDYSQQICTNDIVLAETAVFGSYSGLQINTYSQCPPKTSSNSSFVAPSSVDSLNFAVFVVRDRCFAVGNQNNFFQSSLAITSTTTIFAAVSVNTSKNSSVFAVLYNDKTCNTPIITAPIAPTIDSCNSPSSAFTSSFSSSSIINNTIVISKPESTSVFLINQLNGARLDIYYTDSTCTIPASFSYTLSPIPCTPTTLSSCTYGATSQQYLKTTCFTTLDVQTLLNFITLPAIAKKLFIPAPTSVTTPPTYIIIQQFYDSACTATREIQMVLVDVCVTQQSFQTDGTLVSGITSVMNATVFWTQYSDVECRGSPIAVVEYGIADGACLAAFYRISVFSATNMQVAGNSSNNNSGNSSSSSSLTMIVVVAVCGGVVLAGFLAMFASGIYIAIVRKWLSWNHFRFKSSSSSSSLPQPPPSMLPTLLRLQQERVETVRNLKDVEVAAIVVDGGDSSCNFAANDSSSSSSDCTKIFEAEPAVPVAVENFCGSRTVHTDNSIRRNHNEHLSGLLPNMELLYGSFDVAAAFNVTTTTTNAASNNSNVRENSISGNPPEQQHSVSGKYGTKFVVSRSNQQRRRRRTLSDPPQPQLLRREISSPATSSLLSPTDLLSPSRSTSRMELYKTLGATFSVIKSDIQGNITVLYIHTNGYTQKVQTKYRENPIAFATLEAFVKQELTTSKRPAAEGLLWLKRTLELTAIALRRSFDDRSEELSTSFGKAYSVALAPFHNFLIRPMAMSACPRRADFYRNLGDTSPNFWQEFENWLNGLEKVVASLNLFYSVNGVDKDIYAK